MNHRVQTHVIIPACIDALHASTHPLYLHFHIVHELNTLEHIFSLHLYSGYGISLWFQTFWSFQLRCLCHIIIIDTRQTYTSQPVTGVVVVILSYCNIQLREQHLTKRHHKEEKDPLLLYRQRIADKTRVGRADVYTQLDRLKPNRTGQLVRPYATRRLQGTRKAVCSEDPISVCCPIVALLWHIFRWSTVSDGLNTSAENRQRLRID